MNMADYSYAKKEMNEELLRIGEECLRDIAERCSHKQILYELGDEVSKICDNYWDFKKRIKRELRARMINE